MARWNKRRAGKDEPPVRDVALVQCPFCQETPGYHSYRQVGVDELGRPVFYNAFSQSNAEWYVEGDFWTHLQHMLENAYKTLRGGATGFIWVLDYTGYSSGTEPLANSRTAIRMLNEHFPGMAERIYMGELFATMMWWSESNVCLSPVVTCPGHTQFPAPLG